MSPEFHALIVEGPAGWGKTTAVEEALRSVGIEGIHLGGYSTPLNLFNCLAENSKRFVIIDDCAGLFNYQSSVAILKAATWPQGGQRIVRWGSTSSRATVDEFVFEGKLIIVCNGFPDTADANAVRSRSFPCPIEMTVGQARSLLASAAIDKMRFKDMSKSKSVAGLLSERLTQNSLEQISYRTLRMGYELAVHNPDSWQSLLSGMIKIVPVHPMSIVQQLARQNLKVKEQVKLFEEATGLKRRTFFNYRRKLTNSHGSSYQA